MDNTSSRRILAVGLAGVILATLGSSVWRSFSIRPSTPLGLVAHEGDVAAIRPLVAAGADVNAADHLGYTPLAWAARGGQPLRPHVCRPQDAQHLEAVRVLLELGADPARPSGDGWLADRVARHHRQDAAAELIARACNR